MDGKNFIVPQDEPLQWHPAFYAGIQIEFEEEAENLIFENEHQLGTKPFGIDVLIIKKESEQRIRKNIGRIFRKYNIMEYKSPKDYLSIDDFYKVYAYACFYKSDVELVNTIPIDELTISLVSKKKPVKLIKHLQEERGYEIVQSDVGIYHVIEDVIPIQIIVTSELSREENLWLRNLTDQLDDMEDARRLLDEYQEHEKNALYESALDIIMRVNQEMFQEVKGTMCNALRELMRDEIEEMRKEVLKEGRAEGREEGRKIFIQNLLKHGMLDEEICSLAECEQGLVDEVRLASVKRSK